MRNHAPLQIFAALGTLALACVIAGCEPTTPEPAPTAAPTVSDDAGQAGSGAKEEPAPAPAGSGSKP